MVYLIVFLFSVIVALGAGAFAAWSDFKSMTIPNECHMIVIGAFCFALASVHFSGIDVFSQLPWHLGAAAGIFVVTFLMFQAGMMGGGDSKLLSVYALWTAWVGLLPLIFYMAVFGAVLAVAAITIKKKKPFKDPVPESWLGRVQAGENRVPYGIPIFLGAVVAFIQLGYLSPETMVIFINESAL